MVYNIIIVASIAFMVMPQMAAIISHQGIDQKDQIIQNDPMVYTSGTIKSLIDRMIEKINLTYGNNSAGANPLHADLQRLKEKFDELHKMILAERSYEEEDTINDQLQELLKSGQDALTSQPELTDDDLNGIKSEAQDFNADAQKAAEKAYIKRALAEYKASHAEQARSNLRNAITHYGPVSREYFLMSDYYRPPIEQPIEEEVD